VFEEELKQELAHYRSSTFADNTVRTYRSHLNSYFDFCCKMCIPPVPVTERQVALYAAYLARRLKPSSVRQYLNIIRILHLESGLDHPFKESWLVKTTLKGIEREKGCEVHRKSPVTPEMLLQLKSQLNLNCKSDCIFWAACLVMFFGLLRRSNLFGVGARTTECKQLTRDCFVVDGNSSAVTVLVQWSKTNQFKQRVQKILLPVMHPHPLCPASAVVDMFKRTDNRGPKSQAFPLTPQAFTARLKTLFEGRSDVTSHSFRRGGATWALSCGVPGEIIKMMGDWQSTCYLTYLDQIPQQTVDFYRLKCCRTLPSVVFGT